MLSVTIWFGIILLLVTAVTLGSGVMWCAITDLDGDYRASWPFLRSSARWGKYISLACFIDLLFLCYQKEKLIWVVWLPAVIFFYFVWLRWYLPATTRAH